MLTALQVYYLASSFGLFLYAIYTPSRGVKAFAIGMGLNIFPLAWLPYMDMDLARVGSMPLVYLPVTAVGMALILRNGLHFPRRYLRLYVLIGIYLVYTFCNTLLLRGLSAANFAYWMAWPLNFLMFIAAASIAGRLDAHVLERTLARCVVVLFAASVVGLMRYTAGLDVDANFIPLMNRNGTVVVIALLFPLVFHVYDAQRKPRSKLLLCAGTIGLCVALTFSRSGLVGILLGVILYYWRFTLMGLLKFCAAIMAAVLFLSTGIAERTTERLLASTTAISAMVQGREVDRSIDDGNRVRLVRAAMATAKEHFWFGTGLGMENYREGLRKASLMPVTSKAHNFYISYFAELGLIGYLLLLAVLQRIYAALPPLSSRFRAFRVSFLVMAVMMMMNEYILLPELWVLFGLLSGLGATRPSASISPLELHHPRLAKPSALYDLPTFGLRGRHG